MDVKEKVREIEQEIIEIRRDFHKYPELSNQEFRTMDKICEYLDDWDIEYQKGVAETGVVAIIRGRKQGKTVALRGDIDALPMEEANEVTYKSVHQGVMHACGHDVHTAILLGVGKIFKQMEESLEGNIKLFFQPAEETTGGAERMIKEGCLENPKVDYVLGLHVSPFLEVGKVEIKQGKLYAASDMLTIKIKGRSSHGASPNQGVDPVVIAANVVLSLQTIISRNLSPFQPAVLTLGVISGGTKENIIPNEVEMRGILRTLDQETRRYTKERMKDIIENIPKGLGGKGELIIRESYAPLINDKEVTQKIGAVMKNILGKENVIEKENPNLGAEDFSYFAQAVPSCFYELGCKNDGEGVICDLHSNTFQVNEECIAVGICLQVENALALLKG